MIESLKDVGELTAIDMQTIDKTEDFRNIISQKEALETHREALQKLRSNGGEVDKLIQLEEKILAINREIHQLGVQLGDFVQKESFGNVDFSLVEEKSVWDSMKMYLYGLIVFALVCLAVLRIKKFLRKSPA
jgi:hypothetical protein